MTRDDQPERPQAGGADPDTCAARGTPDGVVLDLGATEPASPGPGVRVSLRHRVVLDGRAAAALEGMLVRLLADLDPATDG